MIVEDRRNLWSDPIPTSAASVPGLFRWTRDNPGTPPVVVSGRSVYVLADAAYATNSIARSGEWAQNGGRLTPGPYVLSMKVSRLAGLAAPRLRVFTFTETGTQLSDTTVPAADLGNGRLSWSFTVPATGARVYMNIQNTANIRKDDWWRFEEIQLDAGTVARGYIDGDMQSGPVGEFWDSYSWEGARGASPSRYVRDRRLTPLVDMSPVPRVYLDIPISAFPPGAVRVNIVRRAEGRTMAVRGGQGLSVATPAVVIDAEAPFGVESTYTAIGVDATGAVVGTWPLGSTTLAFEGTVVQQPFDPNLSVEVIRLLGTAAALSRETPGSLAYPEGRVLPGLVALGPRRALQGVALELLVTSYEAADKLQATLGTYERPQLPVWLIRTPPGNRLPRVFFCHVPKLVEKDLPGGVVDEALVEFSAEVSEVNPPAASITALVLRYSDVGVFFQTYSAVGQRYATYSDIARDTSMIGAAYA